MSDLLEAIFKCDLGVIKVFVNGGKNVNCKVPGAEGCTILHIIAGMEENLHKEEVLSYLLEMGANPNARSYDDLTPVHIAAMWNNCSELEKLLQNKGNPWLIDSDNKNAFDLAYDNKAYDAYQVLNRYHAENKLCFSNEVAPDKKNLENHSSNLSDFEFLSTCEQFPFTSTFVNDENYPYSLNVSKIVKKNDINLKQMTKDISKRNLYNMSKLYNTILSVESSHNDKMSTAVEFITDSLNGFSLVAEKSALPEVPITEEKFRDSTTFIINDWQSFRSETSMLSQYNRSSIEVPESYKKLTDSEIFQELVKYGDRPGPVNDYTRNVYLKRLAKLKTTDFVPVSKCEPKYCLEMQRFLDGELDVNKIQMIANEMSKEFNDSLSNVKWREGNKKCCFNYFLLDSRITQNLPERIADLTFEQIFQTFISAIFYVGKGRKSRPYSHLLEAVKALTDLQIGSDKVNHILDIWNAGYGVISLHCFNNCIPVEAYTQEACIIEALGLKNLTNVKAGDYYGNSTRWLRSLKRKVGIVLLSKALHIFLIEGEKQIKPKDLREKKSICGPFVF